MNNLPTREDCQRIIKESEAFYVTERVVNGYKVEMYDYRRVTIDDFTLFNAWELRGITFVYNPDSGGWERHILMNKFFNVNQVPGWMYEDLKDKKIVRVQSKEDGSIISFVKFPDGKVLAKSKMSFESEQAKMAQEIFEFDKNLRVYVNYALEKNIVPIFELVGPENQIVLEYEKTKLILLQVRDGIDGEYFGVNDYEGLKEVRRRYHINIAKDFSPFHTLDMLLKQKKTNTENIEGWVVTFEDSMVKIKTDHYLKLHGLIGPDAFRENLLVQAVLDGNIDDIISAVVPGQKKDNLVDLERKVSHQFNHLVVEFKDLRNEYFQDFGEARKDFAIEHSKDRLFSGVMKTIDASFRDVEQIAEDQVSLYIKKQCNRLESAKEWLSSI